MTTALRRLRLAGTAGGLALASCMPCLAADADTAGASGEFKLTLGRYHLGQSLGQSHLGTAAAGPGTTTDAAPGAMPGNGTDLNLRYRRGGSSVWLGVYRDTDATRQWRAGWDDQWALPTSAAGPAQLLPSLQLASGGFVGGSLAVQVGAPLYAQLGIGRTNLRPYANLNFDPNDALMATLGWQGAGGRQLAASVIADDRLGTGQQHHHLTLRWPVAAGLRLTADLLHKQGLGDSGPVNTWGWSLGLDGADWFGRLAHDPHQNFSSLDAWRLSAGRRF